MGIYVKDTDFKGKYTIAKNTYTDIDSYITRYEEGYLKTLLGSVLYGLFKVSIDVNGVPTDPIYKFIYDPFSIDENHCQHESRGIKDMLIGYIYFEYIRDQKYKNTVSGTVKGQPENSSDPGFDQSNIYSRYNEAVKTYQQIQWYICKNKTTYPTYNGAKKTLAHWAL